MDLINLKNPMIGKPFNIKHNIHIEVDINEPMGLKGLPVEWLEKLQLAGLNKNEILENAENMICIISKYETGGYMMNRLTFPTNDEFFTIAK